MNTRHFILKLLLAGSGLWAIVNLLMVVLADDAVLTQWTYVSFVTFAVLLLTNLLAAPKVIGANLDTNVRRRNRARAYTVDISD